MKKSNLAVVPRKTSTRTPITISSWNELLVLCRDTDRNGKSALAVRIKLGEMAPRSFGLFRNLKTAQACHREMVAHFENALLDEINALAGIGAKYGLSGLYNVEE